MARVCLPKKERDDLLNALKSKKLTIDELYNLKSAERKALLTNHVGSDFADSVNARFEQAMMSKQKNAMVNWIKSTTSAKSPIRRDMLKKVERIKETLTPNEEGDFLASLAEQKLGIGVTEEEAKNILDLKNNVDTLKSNVNSDSPARGQDRLAYGLAVDKFKNYIGDLKLQAETKTLGERLQGRNIMENITDVAGTAKSLIASLDNSFIGRQGIKTLLRGDYKIWGNSFKTSLNVFGKELFRKAPPGMFSSPDDAVMSMIRADIYSRPNALAGKYAAAKNGYGLGQFHEEAFPVSYPSRIPLLGRLFKASETAFTASALRMRADLADAVISVAENNGIDTLNETQANALGSLVGSLTGRGELTTFAAAGKFMNATLFAPRFLKSNFNTLTAHTFDETMTPYARKQAALSTAKIAASIGAVLTIAETLNPGSVEWDSRSPNFGKIKIDNHRYDITGGMAGMATLASRITPTYHNGEWGFWTKSGTSGNYTKMSQGNYGEQTALDTFEAFFEGKLAPTAGALRDVWKGQKYSGDKPDFINTISGLTVPISAQTLESELKKGNDDVLFAMIAEGLGFSSTNTRLGSYGKKWQTLKTDTSETEMNKALKDTTKRFNKRADTLQASPQWKKMTNEEQSKALNKIKDEEQSRTFRLYGIK